MSKVRFPSGNNLNKKLSIISGGVLFSVLILILVAFHQVIVTRLHASALPDTCNNTGVTKNGDGTYTFAPLHVDSTGTIVDASGCKVHLLGLNQGWFASSGINNPSSALLDSWHNDTGLLYNITRININSYWWNHNLINPDTGNPIKQDYIQAVKNAKSHGEYVMIDIGPQFPEPPCGVGAPTCYPQNQGLLDWQNAPDCQPDKNPYTCAQVQELTSYPPRGLSALKDLVSIFGTDPAILWDVWNEPGGGTPPYDFNTFLKEPDFNAAMQERITYVNTNAPQSLVIVFCNQFSGIKDGNFNYTGNNIVIDHHDYNPNITTTDTNFMSDLTYAQKRGWGMFISEYGGSHDSQNEEDTMTYWAQTYNVGLIYFAPINIIAGKSTDIPVVLNSLGQMVKTSYTSIFASH